MENQWVRFQVFNNTGVAFGGLAGDYINMQCKYVSCTTGSSPTTSLVTLASPEVFSVATATLASGAYATTTAFDASATGTAFTYGGNVEFQVGITNAASGSVSFVLQRSPDGTTWPDNGVGVFLGEVNFTASGAHNGQGEF